MTLKNALCRGVGQEFSINDRFPYIKKNKSLYLQYVEHIVIFSQNLVEKRAGALPLQTLSPAVVVKIINQTITSIQNLYHHIQLAKK